MHELWNNNRIQHPTEIAVRRLDDTNNSKDRNNYLSAIKAYDST